MNKLKNKLFTPPLTTSAQKEIKTSEVSLIGVGNIVRGVLILIGVAVLLVAVGLFFFGLLLVFIRDFLAGRRTTRSVSGVFDLAATLARKRDIGWLGSGIGGIPLGEGVVELRKRIMSVQRKAHMSLDGLNVPAVLIHFRGNSLAHAEDATKRSLHE